MLQTIVKPNTYQDSVSLMLLSTDLSGSDGIERVSIMMGTPANKEIFANTGFETPQMRDAGPSDMVIVVDSDAADAEKIVTAKVEDFLTNQAQASSHRTYAKVASLERAMSELPEANLALISIPGEHAGQEARRTLERGMHTMIFSDNVSVEDEVALKQRGKELGLIVMGPDCGTSMIRGVPLAFANVVREGSIGIVGASGTGTQEVMCQIDRLGGGVSHALGLGGRDLKADVAGLACLQALQALDADPSTEVIVLVSKPPAPSVRADIIDVCQRLTKPVVAVLLGERPQTARDGNVRYAYTLAETARVAVSLAPAIGFTEPQKHVRGLFCGGTLASEAAMLLAEGLDIPEDAEHADGYMIRHDGNEVIDLGDDAYTVGRPHPMMDPSLRATMIEESFDDETLAVLLVDVVLGYGSHPDPATPVAEAVRKGREKAERAGRTVLVAASVCGTSSDPQGLDQQEQTLREAGIRVLPSNEDAVRCAVSAVTGSGREQHSADDSNPLARLLADGPRVINIGLPSFADDLSTVGAPVVQYTWAPIAGGDKRMQQLLAALS